MIRPFEIRYAFCEECDWRGPTLIDDRHAASHAEHFHHATRFVVERRFVWEPDLAPANGPNDLSSYAAGAPKI